MVVKRAAQMAERWEQHLVDQKAVWKADYWVGNWDSTRAVRWAG
jgi:hypothetical protein